NAQQPLANVGALIPKTQIERQRRLRLEQALYPSRHIHGHLQGAGASIGPAKYAVKCAYASASSRSTIRRAAWSQLHSRATASAARRPTARARRDARRRSA